MLRVIQAAGPPCRRPPELEAPRWCPGPSPARSPRGGPLSLSRRPESFTAGPALLPWGSVWRPQADAGVARARSQRLYPHAAACSPQTGPPRGLLPCRRPPQRPSFMALWSQREARPVPTGLCEPPRPRRLRCSPQAVGETGVRLPPRVALAGVLSGRSGATPPGPTALDDHNRQAIVGHSVAWLRAQMILPSVNFPGKGLAGVCWGGRALGSEARVGDLPDFPLCSYSGHPSQCSEFRGGIPHRSLWAPSSATVSRSGKTSGSGRSSSPTLRHPEGLRLAVL